MRNGEKCLWGKGSGAGRQKMLKQGPEGNEPESSGGTGA